MNLGKPFLSPDEMLKEITFITEKQRSNALEILKAVDSIATVAEETSASTEESAAAAEEQAASMEMITSTSQQMVQFAEKLTHQLDSANLKKSQKLEEEVKTIKTESNPEQIKDTKKSKEKSKKLPEESVIQQESKEMETPSLPDEPKNLSF